jgi:protein O-GlcNAc transferase
MSRNDVKIALASAQRMYQSGQLHQAKSAFERVLQLDKKEPDSLHGLGLILFQLGEQQEGIRFVQQAAAVRPRHLETLYNLGIMCQRMDNLTAAVDSFRKVLAINPRYAQAHFALGNALKDLGQLEEAAKSFRQATLLATDWAEPHFNLGNVFRDLSRHEEALQSYKKAVVLKPDWAGAHSNIGHSLIKLKSYEEAILSCKRAIALDPNLSEPHFNMGRALSELKKLIEALISYRMAVILKPDWPEAYNDLGCVLFLLGRHEEAVMAYQKLVSLKPEWAEVYSNLGYLLFYLGRYEEALPVYRKLISLRPEWAEMYNALGLVLIQQAFASMDFASFHEADDCHRKALALKPDLPDTYCNLAASPLRTGLSIDEAADLCQKALELKPDLLAAHQILLFAQQYSQKLTPQIWHDVLEKFAQACFSKLPELSHLNTPEPAKRLRIGYVSPDFRYHACSYFIEPLLSAHDRQQVEIFCYSNVPKADPMTERLKALADHWYDVRGLEIDSVATLIRSHNIDILVDLAGHTADNLLLAFYRKPAPIQASWLGCPSSTGLQAIDYRISDCWLTPQDTPEYYTETIWNLEYPSHCYRPYSQAPAVGPLPAEEKGYITFGSFNNLAKVNLETIALWAQILRGVSNSRILLKSRQLGEPGICSQYIEAFRAEGIAEERIELLISTPDIATHLNLYNRIDIALDSFPYNGATTTLEALWMGVPVITLAGWRTASRYGLSFLAALDLRELAAEDMTQIASIAIALASDLPKLAQLRASLREKMRHSSLCDEANFARTLETAYRQMWKIWCQKQVPV